MKTLYNSDVGVGQSDANVEIDACLTDSASVFSLLKHCPAYHPTPLKSVTALAQRLGVDCVYAKDERSRMNLGSFKALGAAFVVAKVAAQHLQEKGLKFDEYKNILKDVVFVAASAGNHGLSLAAGANLFGASAIIYLSKQVPSAFATKLKAKGAQVVVKGESYEDSMEAAQQAAIQNNWQLVSDSTWNGYDGGLEVMQGYAVMAEEIIQDLTDCPTHVFLQAGVGGLAAAVSANIRKAWGKNFTIAIVEPDLAPALQNSIAAKAVTKVENQAVSEMGRLDCKQASLRAWQNLSFHADYFITITDEECRQSLSLLKEFDLETSPSGAAGFAALLMSEVQENLKIGEQSRVLFIVSEEKI